MADNYLWQFCRITSKPRGGTCVLQGLDCYKDTQIKVYNITDLTAKGKSSDSVQYRNKIYYLSIVLVS